MKHLIIAVTFISCNITVFSQSFQIPKDYKLKNEEDYKKQENNVVEAIDWLIATKYNEQDNKRKEVVAYTIKWLTGSPYVTLEINADIITFSKCQECLLMFMLGWTRYSIESERYGDRFNGNFEGVKTAIAFYKKNKDIIGKNKKMEKYIELQNDGELELFIKSKVDN